MSSNLNSSARPFQPVVSSSEKAQLEKFSKQLEDEAEIKRLREAIMKEREARQISQPALLPRAPQNTQMLRSFQPPVILPSPLTSPSTSPSLEQFNK